MRGKCKLPLILTLPFMNKIIQLLQKIIDIIKKLNQVGFILIFTIVLILFSFCFNYLLRIFEHYDIIWLDFPDNEENVIILFITSVILAPIFETLLNQSLPYYLLNKIEYLKRRRYLILLVSGVFFGLLHCYSLFYIFYAFILGLLFMYGYMLRIENDKSTFWNISICHSLLNLGIFIRNIS